MKIGIILFSQTGNTLSVGKKLQENFASAGHNVELESLKVSGELRPAGKNIQFETLPDIEEYDVLVFGSPVWAFSLSSPMSKYLSQIASLQGKKVALMATQQFPFPWLGGNHAINQMKKLCEEKGASVSVSGIINWGKSNREQQIVEVVNKLSTVLS